MTIDGNTITAESGMVLINADGDVIGNKLSLGCGDAVENYFEITIAEAEEQQIIVKNIDRHRQILSNVF